MFTERLDVRLKQWAVILAPRCASIRPWPAFVKVRVGDGLAGVVHHWSLRLWVVSVEVNHELVVGPVEGEGVGAELQPGVYSDTAAVPEAGGRYVDD